MCRIGMFLLILFTVIVQRSATAKVEFTPSSASCGDLSAGERAFLEAYLDVIMEELNADPTKAVSLSKIINNVVEANKICGELGLPKLPMPPWSEELIFKARIADTKWPELPTGQPKPPIPPTKLPVPTKIPVPEVPIPTTVGTNACSQFFGKLLSCACFAAGGVINVLANPSPIATEIVPGSEFDNKLRESCDNLLACINNPKCVNRADATKVFCYDRNHCNRGHEGDYDRLCGPYVPGSHPAPDTYEPDDLS